MYVVSEQKWDAVGIYTLVWNPAIIHPDYFIAQVLCWARLEQSRNFFYNIC